MRRVVAALAVLLPLAAHAQTAEQMAVVQDFNSMAGALQATSGAFEHAKTSLRVALEKAAKDEAELDYWRKYFAGMPKPEAK